MFSPDGYFERNSYVKFVDLWHALWVTMSERNSTERRSTELTRLVGDRVRELRTDLGMTMATFAEARSNLPRDAVEDRARPDRSEA